jgi:uncharacterized protein YndB with AHSA1/START domain
MTDDRPTGIADTDVYMSRAFAAPRDVVWRFWTEPALLARWFGPTGFHVPVESVDIDMRPGGRWNLDMVSDETGERFPLRTDILEVERPEHFVGDAVADTDTGFLENMRLRVQLHDHGAWTRVTIHQGPFTPVLRDRTIEGWELSFQKLDALFTEEEP